MEKPLSLNVDKVYHALGPTGRYQCVQFFLMIIGKLPTYVQLLDNVFIGGSVNHRCAEPQRINSTFKITHPSLPAITTSSNYSVIYDECHIRIKDSDGLILSQHSCLFGMEYDAPISQSVVSQFDLVCDKDNLLSLSQTLAFAGQGLGALLGPYFSDRYGRKSTIVAFNLLTLLLGIVIALAPNYFVFAGAKLLVGAAQQGLYIPTSIFMGELLPTEYRRYSIMLSCSSWALSGCIMTIIAYLMQGQSWRYLQLVLSLSSLGAFVQLCFMDESIVWLLANNKKTEVLKCIKQAAKWNGKDYEKVLEAGHSEESCNKEITLEETKSHDGSGKDDPDSCTNIMLTDLNKPPLPNGKENVEEHVPLNSGSLCDGDDNGDGDKNQQNMTTVVKDHESICGQNSPQKMSFLHILRIRRLLINAVAMWITWFSASLCYFTLYFLMSTLAGDKYLNYFLTSLTELPACFIFFFGFNRIGRRSVTILLYSLLAVCTLTLGLMKHFTNTEDEPWSVFTLIVSLLAIIGGSGCFFSVFFYLPELFPTNLRNQATGFASCFARMGAMISPFMGSLASIAIWSPGVVMAGLATIAVFLLTLLPETKDKQLPQSIEELKSWSKGDAVKNKKNQMNNSNPV